MTNRCRATQNVLSVLAMAGCAYVILSTVVEAATPQEIARSTFHSVVLLVMQDAARQTTSLGSGFLVEDGVIATNLHVIEGASHGYAKHIAQTGKIDIRGVVGVDPAHDLVLLRVSSPHVAPLPIAGIGSVEVGDTVYVVGNPQGLEGTFSQGIISSIRDVGGEKLLQITAPISPGSSGGPVLDSRGQVIGVAVATFRGGQNLNFAIPSNYLKALLSGIQVVTPLPNAVPSTNKRSIVDNLGGRSTTGVLGEQFKWDNWPPGPISNYSFSLRNQLQEDVSNIYCLVVFYDPSGNPVHVDTVRYRDVIPSGLAKRVTGSVHRSVQNLTSKSLAGSPERPIEFRILDFQLLK